MLPVLSFSAVVAACGAWLHIEAVAAAATANTTAAIECRPQDLIVPRPNLTKSANFQNATAQLTDVLDAAVNGSINAGWDVPNTSFSVAVVVKDQASAGIPVWEYHHLGSNCSNGTQTVDRDSQYLIGSISKTLTTAVLLRSGVDLNDPITKYLPTLDDGPSLISWENITLRALTSQLSGIPPNLGLSEFYYLKNYSLALGFPEITDQDYLPCDVTGLNSPCTQNQSLQTLKTVHPVAPPMTRPVYSNLAFNLLMYALEGLSGKNYSQLLSEYLTQPFSMTNTFPSPGDNARGVIPNFPSSWGADYVGNTPTGGLVSTISDMSIFVHSVLTYNTLDSATAVRGWLQPHSFLGSLYSSFGMPWEIFRPPPEVVFPEGQGHTLTMYKKDGMAVGYSSRIAILDEYGMGFIVLTAGDTKSIDAISNAVLATVAPAIDIASRDQTRELGYTGTFANNCGGVQFNATVSMDDKGLALSSMMRNDTDIILTLKAVYDSTLTLASPSFQINPSSTPRLYPGEISTNSTIGNRSVTREDWRLIWDDTLNVATDLPGQGITSFDCRVWQTVDLVYFGHEPIDRLVFVKDAETGEVLGLDMPFLRSNATKGSACWEDIAGAADN